MTTADVRRTRMLVIWLTSVGWLALAFFAVASTRAPIEQDLTEKSVAALEAAGLDGVQVSFEGRDATLRGTVASETDVDSASAVVLGVEGVRTVDSLLTTALPPGATPPTTAPEPTTQPPVNGSGPPSFVMLVSDGRVALTGSVPDEEMRDALVAGAVEAFGLENVVSTLSVNTALGHPPWLQGLPFMVAQMGDVTEFSLVIAGGAVELSGLAISEAARDSIGRLVELSLPGLELENRLEIGTDERELVQRKINSLDLRSITFSVGGSELDPAGMRVLEDLLAILEDHPSISVEVGGHTDATGSEESNLEISQARAQAVVDYLVSEGLDPSRLAAVGYGSSQPVADNFTEEGRARNRRIEIVVQP